MSDPTTPAQQRDPLRVAIIGYGLAGAVFHAPLVSSAPGMQVAAIVTANSQRQQQAQHDYPDTTVYATSDELFAHASQYDLVVVAAPNRAHVTLGEAALNAGLPVVIDKPIASTVAEAEHLLATANSTGKLLTVFQNRRWDNDFLTLQKLIAADLLGPVQRLESRFERFIPAPRANAWRERADLAEGGGLLFDLGAHLIDQAVVLFGPPTSVYAEVDSRRAGAAVDDDTFVALRFTGNQAAHLWMSAIPRHFGPRFRVVGLRGVYEKYHLDPQEAVLKAGGRPGDTGWGKESPDHWGHLYTEVGGLAMESVVETLPGSYESYYAGVRDALWSGSQPPVNAADAVATLRIFAAARESARTGAAVHL